MGLCNPNPGCACSFSAGAGLTRSGSGAPGDPVTLALAFEDVAWVAPTFKNSWVNYGSGYEEAGYRKIGDVVYLRGIIKTGASTSVAFTLPSGYRPPQPVQFAINGNGNFAYLEVQADGDVQIVGSGVSTATALDGVYFSVTA